MLTRVSSAPKAAARKRITEPPEARTRAGVKKSNAGDGKRTAEPPEARTRAGVKSGAAVKARKTTDSR